MFNEVKRLNGRFWLILCVFGFFFVLVVWWGLASFEYELEKEREKEMGKHKKNCVDESFIRVEKQAIWLLLGVLKKRTSKICFRSSRESAE